MHVDPKLLPNDSLRAVESLAEAFDSRRIHYALIGGLAFVLRGRPRFTQDMVAFRPQYQVDIETLLTANRDEIDLNLIREQWSPFATTEPERTAWLESAIARRVERRE